jgi:hypothetical protein
MRRRWIVLLLALAACGRMEFMPMPETIGEWRRGAVTSSEPSEPHRQLGAKAAIRSVFRRADASIAVEAVFFGSAASAFEARQKHTAPDTIAFHRGPVFVLCTSSEPRRAVIEFSSALESAWLSNVR